MTVKVQSPVLVEQFYSDGKCLVEISSVGSEYVAAVDVVSEKEVVIPVREIGHDWFRIIPAKSEKAKR